MDPPLHLYSCVAYAIRQLQIQKWHCRVRSHALDSCAMPCVQGTGLASHRSNGNKTTVAESFALTSQECQDIRYALIFAVACCTSCQQMLLACAAHLIVWAAQPCCRPPVAILYIAPADAIQLLS